ncbi:MAG: hypothetical protein Q9169_007624 [Polycauliona sp. 2 TL-2023]
MPAEMRLRIFESCPDLATAASLAQASKDFNGIWVAFKDSICSVILKQAIVCYDDASGLAKQQMFKKRSTTLTSRQQFKKFTAYMVAIAKAAEFVYDAIIHDPSVFGPMWEHDPDDIVGVRIQDGRVILSALERQRFISTWYRIRII